MNRIILAVTVCSGLGMVAGAAFAGGPQTQPAEPTQAEIHQKALKDGPATPQIDYPTKKNSVPPYEGTASSPSKPVPPLTQREIGMLYNACVAYPECKTAYAGAKEHEQALLKAKQRKAADDPGD
jgi:hypothetical protein